MPDEHAGRRIVYIAGPYHGDDNREFLVWDRIMLARNISMLAWKLGHIPIVPHLNSMLLGGFLPGDIYLSGDLEIIRRCVDVMWVLPGWYHSPGTMREMHLAIFEKKIPVRLAELPVNCDHGDHLPGMILPWYFLDMSDGDIEKVR